MIDLIFLFGFFMPMLAMLTIADTKPEPVLLQYIRNRVKNQNKNFVVIFVGPTGSGKSYSGLKLGEELDPTFNISRVCFKPIQFMNCVNELVKQSEAGEDISGKVLMWDELGASHSAREFMTISNRLINYFFQTSRHLNLIVIMTVPLLSFIDSNTRKLCHAVAEMKGINAHDKTAQVKVKMLQTNVISGKEYPKYLRYRKNNKQFVAKRINFKLPSKELLKDYEEKKTSFTSQLNKDIMSKLIGAEEKDNRANRSLTPAQENVAKMLMKNSIDEVAESLGVVPSSIYAHKSNMERKGVIFKPIWQDKRIIRWDIQGSQLNSDENQHKNPN